MSERLPNERFEWQRMKVWSTPKMEFVGPVGNRMTDAEVLAEMGTEALVEELNRRGVLSWGAILPS